VSIPEKAIIARNLLLGLRPLREPVARPEGGEKEVGDFTAVSIIRERISPSRSAKIFFVTVFDGLKDLSPSPGFCVGCRVGARSGRARCSNVPRPLMTITRRLGLLARGLNRITGIPLR